MHATPILGLLQAEEIERTKIFRSVLRFLISWQVTQTEMNSTIFGVLH